MKIKSTTYSSSADEDVINKRMAYLGQYLRELRINQHQQLSQAVAAEMIGVNRNSIQNAEQGHNITVHTLILMIDFYNADLGDLFGSID